MERDRWSSGRDPDEVALERYRYLLRTAPPEDLERAHEEAFASLTPDQRRQLLEGLAEVAGPAEARDADTSPQRLARLATRTELRQPGTMERVFGPRQGGGGWGGPGLAGSFLSTIAGVVVGTAIANALFFDLGDPAADAGYTGEEGSPDAGSDAGSGEVDGGGWGDEGGMADAGGFDGGGDLDLGGFDLGGF